MKIVIAWTVRLLVCGIALVLSSCILLPPSKRPENLYREKILVSRELTRAPLRALERDLFEECLSEDERRRPDYERYLLIEWVIDRDGKARRINALVDRMKPKGRVARCITQIVRATEFQRHDDRPLRVILKFVRGLRPTFHSFSVSQKPANRKRPSRSSPRNEASNARNGLTKYDVYDTINERIGAIQFCFELGLGRTPKSPEGIVRVEWMVRSDGGVRDVSIVENTVRDREVGRCIEDVISALEFPRHGGKDIKISFPFIYKLGS